MQTSIGAQQRVSDEQAAAGYDFSYHVTTDALVRHVRDRRLRIALSKLRGRGVLDPAHQRVLVVCGGAGGEGILLRRLGFTDVTVTDISDKTLDVCRRLAPGLKTMQVNAEDMAEIPDNDYDLVVVQDGLHHLPRPALGFTEMLRVARTAVIVIEPHESLVGRLIGTKWEVHGETVNYVFRWNASFLKQVTLSYLLRSGATVLPYRLWDHCMTVSRLARRFPRRLQVPVAKAVYGTLAPFGRLGNMMIGVVILGGSGSDTGVPASRSNPDG